MPKVMALSATPYLQGKFAFPSIHETGVAFAAEIEEALSRCVIRLVNRLCVITAAARALGDPMYLHQRRIHRCYQAVKPPSTT